jgi:hypothetical protein
MATFRDKLIRANFEAYLDLTWMETLEPRFRDHGQDKASIEKYRQAWNEQTEKNDWPWWQEHSKRFSNAVLEDERMECIDRMDSLGMLHRQRDKTASERELFQRILNATLDRDREEKPQEQSLDLGRGL